MLPDGVDPGATEARRAAGHADEHPGRQHFNAGLRGMFFSIGYLGWFVGPVALGAVDAACCSPCWCGASSFPRRAGRS